MFKLPLRATSALRNPLILATRAQSTKPTTLNRSKGVKNAVAAKVAQQAKNSDYNALSNHNLTLQENKTPDGPQNTFASPSQKTKVKKDYSAIPRVPSTDHLNPQKVAIDSLYAGYRPLAMHGLKQNLLPPHRHLLEVEDTPIWLYSAAGLNVFEEWERVPYMHFKDLTPFKPPMTDEQKAQAELEKKFDWKAMLPEKDGLGVPAPPKVRKGRLRPQGIKLLKKKKKASKS